MKNILIALFIFVSANTIAQSSVNDYKYAVVPKKFDFLNETDKHMLNTYTKMYMEKYGFTTYFNDEVPMELANDNCNKIYVDVESNKTIFVTKLTVVIKDCTNKVLFKSTEGSSREKEFKVAYQQALRDAFNSFNSLNYKYSGKENAPKSKEAPSVAAKTMTVTPISSEAAAAVLTTTAANTENLLFAQPIPNGFQIVDTTPKVILKLKETSKQDVFIAERDSITGLLFNSNGTWIFEYYLDGKLRSESMNIRF